MNLELYFRYELLPFLLGHLLIIGIVGAVLLALLMVLIVVFRKPIVEFYKKHKMVILYLVFGVLTTVVNIVCFALFRGFFSTSVIPNIIAWVVSVLFAFFTNKYFVFDTGEETVKTGFIYQLLSFVAARLLTGVMDLAIVYIFADKIGFNPILVKVASNVLVVIINYIASKLVIFRKDKNN